MKKTRSKEMSRKLNVAIEILCLSRVFLPATNCYLIVTFNSTPLFCTFTLLHLFSFLVFFFFWSTVINCKIFAQLSTFFERFFFFCIIQQFATLNSLDILILEFSWNLIPVTFPLKVAKTFSLHSRHFLWK